MTEADGGVYPCDFYVLDEYRLGNFNENTLEEIDRKRHEIGFVKRSPPSGSPVPGMFRIFSVPRRLQAQPGYRFAGWI